MYRWIGLLVFFQVISVYSQSKKIDSLQHLLVQLELKNNKATLSDSVRVNLLCKIAYEQINFDINQAQITQKKGLYLATKIKDTLGIIKSHNGLARIYLNQSDFNDAIQQTSKALHFNYKRKSLEECYTSHLLKGQAYLFLNNFPEAYQFFTNALQIAERLNDPSKEARVYNNIAIIYNKQGRIEEEFQNYKKALSRIKNTHNQTAEGLRSIINSNVGLIYLERKQLDKALAIFEEGIAFEKKRGNKNSLGMSFRSLSKVYFEKKEYTQSLAYAQKALASFKELKNKSGEADMYREIGAIFLQTNQLNDALSYTQKGLQISTQIGELESIKFGYQNLSLIYAKLHNYEEAYRHQILFKKMSDSIFNSEVNNKVTQIQMTYEFEKKQKLLQLEQQEKNKKLQLKTKKQQNFLVAIVLTLLFLSVITIGIYSNLKAYKKQKQIVELQKEQIQHSLTEKETLLREIHHRVKNNLQIISSLLNMQSEDIEDPKVLLSIQEGQSRVQAMSLIHQNLYQSETIDKVNIENYFKELTQHLSTMYLGNSDAVKVVIQAAGIQFDFDTAIPLGLIVNELVSNAYKHVFANQKEGQISIVLQTINQLDYQLLVRNNGVPLPTDFDIKKLKSLGIKLITILSKQLRGSFSQIESDQTTFQVVFKDVKKYNAIAN